MMRFLLAFLLLAGVGWADVPYRWKLLTAADVRLYLPKGNRIDPSLEEFERQGYQGIEQYEYKYKKASILYLKSTWAVRLDSASAKDEYSKLAVLQSLNPLAEADWSKLVRVGDQSCCKRLKGGRVYCLCGSKGNCLGYFTLGLQRPMTARELQQLADSWIRRADGMRPKVLR